MNQQQNKYFRMFLNTQDYLDDQNHVWSAVPRISTYKNDFDEIIARIVDKSEEAQSVQNVGGRKDRLRAQLGLKVSSLSGTLQAYAWENENTDLVEKVEISKSGMDKMRENDVDGFVKSVVGIAQEKLDDLVDFGITESMLTEILTTLEEFNGLIGKPRNILNSKYVALDGLDNLVDEGNNLLNKKMDKIMLMFRESNPAFYNGYERARTIVD